MRHGQLNDNNNNNNYNDSVSKKKRPEPLRVNDLLAGTTVANVPAVTEGPAEAANDHFDEWLLTSRKGAKVPKRFTVRQARQLKNGAKANALVGIRQVGTNASGEPLYAVKKVSTFGNPEMNAAAIRHERDARPWYNIGTWGLLRAKQTRNQNRGKQQSILNTTLGWPTLPLLQSNARPEVATHAGRAKKAIKDFEHGNAPFNPEGSTVEDLLDAERAVDKLGTLAAFQQDRREKILEKPPSARTKKEVTLLTTLKKEIEHVKDDLFVADKELDRQMHIHHRGRLDQMGAWQKWSLGFLPMILGIVVFVLMGVYLPGKFMIGIVVGALVFLGLSRVLSVMYAFGTAIIIAVVISVLMMSI